MTDTGHDGGSASFRVSAADTGPNARTALSGLTDFDLAKPLRDPANDESRVIAGTTPAVAERTSTIRSPISDSGICTRTTSQPSQPSRVSA